MCDEQVPVRVIRCGCLAVFPWIIQQANATSILKCTRQIFIMIVVQENFMVTGLMPGTLAGSLMLPEISQFQEILFLVQNIRVRPCQTSKQESGLTKLPYPLPQFHLTG